MVAAGSSLGRLAVLGLVLCAAMGCRDTVFTWKREYRVVGLLVDGKDAEGPFQDRAFARNATWHEVGELDARDGDNDEVVAFARGRVVRCRHVSWTPKRNWVHVYFEDPILVPVTVWIVTGDYDERRQQALRDLVVANAIFRSERMGIYLCAKKEDFVDATGDDPDERDARQTEFGQLKKDEQDDLREKIGFHKGRLNVYYVGMVGVVKKDAQGEDYIDLDSGNGQAFQQASDMIALGDATCDHLLAHEVGHCLFLQHIDAIDEGGLEKTENGQTVELIPPGLFGTKNIMSGFSIDRETFTEGQIYRAHLDASSILNEPDPVFPSNAIPDLRPERPRHKQMPLFERGKWAPWIHERIWDDMTPGVE